MGTYGGKANHEKRYCIDDRIIMVPEQKGVFVPEKAVLMGAS